MACHLHFTKNLGNCQTFSGLVMKRTIRMASNFISNQTRKSPLEHALECATNGWAVFPASLDKTPRTKRGHLDASTDPARICGLHTHCGFVLVGIRTGESSNLAVLDIDRQHNGQVWWQENRHRLSATRTHRTRSGGLHLWFEHHPGLRCSTARIAPGIDVKAEGGAVIYWPATGLPVLCDARLAPWPAWLIPPEKPAPPPRHEPAGQRPAAHIAAQLAGLIRTIAIAPQGQRNASLFWAASRTAEIIAQGQLSRPHAEAILIEAAARAGLDHLESSRTIASAFTRRAA